MAPRKENFTQDSRDPVPSDDEEISEPAPPFHSSQDTVALKLTTSGPFRRTLHVSDYSGKEIYHCESHTMSKPHLFVLASGTNLGERSAEVATITYSPFNNTFNMVLNGQEIRVGHSGIFKSRYSFRSPHLRQNLTWYGGSTSVLEDQTGTAIARLKYNSLAPWLEREIEILKPYLEGREGRRVQDEVVCSAVAVMELKRRRRGSWSMIGPGGSVA